MWQPAFVRTRSWLYQSPDLVELLGAVIINNLIYCLTVLLKAASKLRLESRTKILNSRMIDNPRVQDKYPLSLSCSYRSRLRTGLVLWVLFPQKQSWEVTASRNSLIWKQNIKLDTSAKVANTTFLFLFNSNVFQFHIRQHDYSTSTRLLQSHFTWSHVRSRTDLRAVLALAVNCLGSLCHLEKKRSNTTKRLLFSTCRLTCKLRRNVNENNPLIHSFCNFQFPPMSWVQLVAIGFNVPPDMSSHWENESFLSTTIEEIARVSKIYTRRLAKQTKVERCFGNQ